MNEAAPAKVAEWAFQSVEILFRIYAKFLDGCEAALQRLIETAIGHRSDRAENLAVYLPQLVDLSQ